MQRSNGWSVMVWVALVGCSSGGSSNAPTDASTSTADDGSSEAATTPGLHVGDGVPDLALSGYVRDAATGLSSSVAASNTTLHAVLAAGSEKYALIKLSAFWCSVCQASTKRMITALPSFSSKAMVIEIIVEGDNPSAGTPASEVTSWVTAEHTPYSVLRDPDGAPLFAARTALGTKDTDYVLDRATGKILAKASTPEDAITALQALP